MVYTLSTHTHIHTYIHTLFSIICILLPFLFPIKQFYTTGNKRDVTIPYSTFSIKQKQNKTKQNKIKQTNKQTNKKLLMKGVLLASIHPCFYLTVIMKGV